MNSFLLNRYSSLTVFIWQNLSISASGHRKNMILTYFETISRVEFSQCDITDFHRKNFPIQSRIRFQGPILNEVR